MMPSYQARKGQCPHRFPTQTGAGELEDHIQGRLKKYGYTSL